LTTQSDKKKYDRNVGLIIMAHIHDAILIDLRYTAVCSIDYSS